MNKKNTLLLVSFLLITSIAFSNDNETFFFENDIFSQIKRTINNAETVNATVTIDFSGAIASPYQEDFYEVSPSAGGNSISYAANATTTHTYSAVSGTPTVTLVSFDLYSASSNGSHTVTIGGETLATNTLGWNTYTIADFPGSPDWVFESGTFTISVFEALFNDVAIDNIVLTDIAPAADTTPPVITLNTPTIQTIEVGTAYSELGATATDNVDAANTLNVTPTVINENTAVVGSFTVDYNVSDAAGNAATKVTRTVNVVDTTAPVITSSVLVQEIDEGGTALGQFFANETVTWSINDYNNLGLEISTDGFVTITAGAVIGNQYYYDVTATDVSPNINHSTSIQTIVTVNDITAPVIALNTPTIQTIEVGAAYSELGATATDNVDAGNTLIVIPTVNNENTAVVGSFTVDYNVSDAAGNAATEVTRTVNVVDTTAPTVVTKDITVQLDANGNASITAGDIDNGSSDNSGNVTLSLGSSSLQAGFNNTALDSGFELVNGADWVSGISGSGNLNGAFVAKKTSSGRNYLRTVASDFINSDFEVIFTYDDSNVASGGDMLTFLGIGDPSVTEGLFPEPDLGIYLRDHSNQNNSADHITSRLSGVASYTSNSYIPEGKKRVKMVKSGNQITFFIDSGNAGTFPINGQGFDLTSAGSNFLNDTNSYIFFGSGSTNVQLDEISITSTSQPGVYDCASLGQNAVNLVVTDVNGNTATAAATVTVEDNMAPTIALLGDASVTHEALTAYTDLGATTADNCSATLTVTDDINVNTIGIYTVTYTATDSSGNVTTATRTVNVVDTTKPVITLIGDNPQIVTLNTAYEELGATAADNYNGDITTSIGINTLAIDLATVNCYPVTYNVSDASGNNAVQLTRIVFVLEYGKPLAKSDTKTVAQDSKDNLFTIIGNDSYGLDGAHADHPIALSGTYTDNGGKLDLVGDEVKYTPRAGFFGDDKFSYTITDENGDASTAEVTITVTEGSVANNLTAVADEKTVIRGGTTTIVVLSNDLLGTATAADLDAITISNNINGAVITVNSDNSIEYESVSTFSGSEDTFEYTIKETGTDNLSTAIVRVIIEDSAVTDSVLSAKNDEVSVAQNSTDNEIAVLLDNGFDIDSFGLDGAIDNGLTFLDGTLTGLSEQGTIIVDTKGTTTPLDDVIVYTPNTGFVGVDHFYYMITDTTGASSIAQVAITVTEIDTPTAADDAIEILEGSVAAVTIDVLDNDSFGSNGAASPDSLEIISSGTGTAVVVNGTSIEYTPTGTQTGTDTFTYSIKDAFGKTSDATVTVTFTTVIASDAPKAQDDAVIFAQDSSENIINILDDNGSGADNYGSGAEHPSHPISLVAFYSEEGGALELDGTTVKYTPRTGYFGEDTFDYLITDENGVSDRATVTITVTEGSVANNLTAVADEKTVIRGGTTTIVVLSNDLLGTATAADLDAITISNNINGAVITVNSDNSIEYESVSTFSGSEDTFEYTIKETGTDNLSTAIVRVIIEDSAVTDSVLSAKRDEVSVAQNSTDNEIAVLLDNGFDIDSFGLDGAIDNGLTFLDGTLTGLSEQGTIIVDTKGTTTPLDDVIVYTPNTGFVGVDHFYYMITDTTGASSIAQVAITVTEIDAPTAADDAIEILEGSVAAVTIDVLDNDSFGSNGAALSNSLEIIPTTTTAVVVNGTSIEYTPTGTQTGTDTFTYRIKDADGETSDATVTVTFTAVIASDAPKAQDDAVIFAQDSSENIINILDDNGSGADNYGSGAAHPSHPISLVAFYSEEGGSLELDGTTVKYTPRTGYFGEDTFDYLITDENGVSDRATVTITVTGSVANGLTAVADEVAAVEGVTRTINVLANDVFETGTLEAVVISNESGEVTITVNSDNTLEYTYTVAPGATFTGTTDTFNYTIKEAGTANESTATVTVTIQAADAVNGVPEAKGDTFSVVQGIMSSLAVLADNGSGVDNFGSDGENTTNPLRLFNGTTEGKSVKQIEREAQGSSAFNNLVVNSGKIEYTPVAAFIGEDSFYYKIVDASGDESIAQVTINVTSSKSSGIVTTDAVIKDLQVYPNPSKGAFKVLVYSEKAEQASVLLFDVTGKVVYNKKQLLSAGNNTMNLHVNVQTGILFLKVYTDNTNFGTKKILFE
ncbi:Ig-like domain-containing protein [uncultured Polaribacter sp.]|uniref:Ig-like domain-containing protein n=1 Tax=uncultured Polaribacter sp. TaxID=174711 RepID=UPI0026026908|nr:Ig-like domain-containing protein [uncultured Polaribacter sp.]